MEYDKIQTFFRQANENSFQYYKTDQTDRRRTYWTGLSVLCMWHTLDVLFNWVRLEEAKFILDHIEQTGKLGVKASQLEGYRQLLSYSFPIEPIQFCKRWPHFRPKSRSRTADDNKVGTEAADANSTASRELFFQILSL